MNRAYIRELKRLAVILCLLVMPAIVSAADVRYGYPVTGDYEATILGTWEGFNRGMYRFNYYFDRYALLPVVRGAGSGPYLVLPVLGPNTLRSAGGFAADAGIRFAVVNAVDPLENVEHGNAVLAGITVVEGVDMRHRQKFRYYDSGYPFEYEMVRFLYYKMGELQVMK